LGEDIENGGVIVDDENVGGGRGGGGFAHGVAGFWTKSVRPGH
jgi:hypothetical protein